MEVPNNITKVIQKSTKVQKTYYTKAEQKKEKLNRNTKELNIEKTEETRIERKFRRNKEAK